MSTICTSCGAQIPPSLSSYKCRQCVNHFVCQLCEKKDHNRASAAFHTLEEIPVPNVSSTNSNVASSKIDKKPQPTNTNTSSNSSIFNSDAYLYTALSFCDHCQRFFGSEDTVFECQQCPINFTVCSQCYPLMSTHHPLVHTFSKILSADVTAKIISNFYHIGISCDGCSIKSFNGRRYQCEQCPSSYDLCENCFGKEHTHHKFKYIQHPALHASNQNILGLRTLASAEKNGNNNWRDPLTSWTKSDAKQVIQQGKQEQQNYENQLQQIRKKNEQKLEESKRRLQQEIDFSNHMTRFWLLKLS